MAARLFRFPDPVNEVSARLVAAGVAVMCAGTILADQPWATAVIAYGFVARALTGPALSPLGLLVTRVITPRLPIRERLVAGPPKRFAQSLGAVLAVTAAVLALGFGQTTAGYVVLGAVLVAATLESVFAFCIGCDLRRAHPARAGARTGVPAMRRVRRPVVRPVPRVAAAPRPAA